MVRKGLVIALIAIVFVMSIQQASSLMCYNCIAPIDFGCGDPFNRTANQATICTEGTCATLKYNNTLILRSCTDSNACSLPRPPGADCYTCTTDGCNGADQLDGADQPGGADQRGATAILVALSVGAIYALF